MTEICIYYVTWKYETFLKIFWEIIGKDRSSFSLLPFPSPPKKSVEKKVSTRNQYIFLCYQILKIEKKNRTVTNIVMAIDGNESKVNNIVYLCYSPMFWRFCNRIRHLSTGSSKQHYFVRSFVHHIEKCFHTHCSVAL